MQEDLSPTISGFGQAEEINFDNMPEGASSNELTTLNYYFSKAVQLSNKENFKSKDVIFKEGWNS